MKKFILGVLFLPLLALVFGAILLFGGYIPTAANQPDSALLSWAAHTAYEQNIARKAESIEMPEPLPEWKPSTLLAVRAMCTGCHTPLGQSPSVIAQGLNPKPPPLAELAQELTPAERFVVLRDGVRMTGMPAFGPSHDDADLWEIVSLLGEIAQWSGEDYVNQLASVQAQLNEASGSRPQSDGHDHDHGNMGNLSPSASHVEEKPSQDSAIKTETSEPAAHDDHSDHDHHH